MRTSWVLKDLRVGDKLIIDQAQRRAFVVRPDRLIQLDYRQTRMWGGRLKEIGPCTFEVTKLPERRLIV